MNVDAVVFDMDGVLIDSEPLHFSVVNEVLAATGNALTREQNEAFIGTTNGPFWAAMIDRFGLPEPASTYIAQYDASLLRVLERSHAPRLGVPRLVRRARELELRLAVASSSPRSWIAATLRSIGLADVFPVIVSGDDVAPEQGKPHPAIYLLAAERLGIPPARCLAIEDSPNGVLSAHRAGMRVIGVRTSYTAHLRLEGADQIVGSLAELSFE